MFWLSFYSGHRRMNQQGIFNISTGKAISLNKVVDIFTKISGKEAQIRYIKDFKQEILGYCNNDRLINELYKSSDNIYKFLPKKSSQAFDEWKKIIYKLKK